MINPHTTHLAKGQFLSLIINIQISGKGLKLKIPFTSTGLVKGIDITY